MTENEQKQQFSFAYVHAVASRAGITCQIQVVDFDSVDVILGADGWVHKEAVLRSPRLEVQLKATSQDVLRSDHLTFTLPRKNYDDLRERSLIPRLLVVLLMPGDLEEWLQQSEAQMLLRRAAYWLSLRGMPQVETTTVTVHLPRANLFTAVQLRELMERVSREESL